MGIINSTNKQFKNFIQDQEFKIPQKNIELRDLFIFKEVEENKNLKEREQSMISIDTFKEFTNNFEKSNLSQFLQRTKRVDWYDEIFTTIFDKAFDRKNKKSKKYDFNPSFNYCDPSIFQVIENFHIFTYQLVHYFFSNSNQFHQLHVYKNKKTKQLPELGRRRSSVVTLKNLIDNSYEQNQSIVYNQKMNFGNSQDLNLNKIDINLIHIAQGDNMDYFQIENLDLIKEKHWKKGFVYKNVFFKYLTDQIIMKKIIFHINNNAHEFFTIDDFSIKMKCIFSYFSMLNAGIFATPLIFAQQKLKDFYLYKQISNIQLECEIPAFEKINHQAVLYFYSSLTKQEQIFKVDNQYKFNNTYIDFLKLKHYYWFTNKSQKINFKKIQFNENESIFKTTTFLIFKYRENKNEPKYLQEIVEKLKNTKENLFQTINLLRKQYRLDYNQIFFLRNKVPRIIQFNIDIYIFVVIIKCLYNDTRQVKITNINDFNYFYDFIMNICFLIKYDQVKLYFKIAPYLLIYNVKTYLNFEDSYKMQPIKDQLNRILKTIQNYPYYFYQALVIKFKIEFHPKFYQSLRINQTFISQDQNIASIKLTILKSCDPIKIFDYYIFKEQKKIRKYQYPFWLNYPIDQITSIQNFEKWTNKLKSICYIINYPAPIYKQLYNQYLFLYLDYCIRKQSENQFKEVIDIIQVLAKTPKERFLNYFFQALHLELSVVNERESGRKLNNLNTSIIYYKKSFEILLGIVGDPRMQSFTESYFLDYLTRKIVNSVYKQEDINYYEELIESQKIARNEYVIFNKNSNLTYQQMISKNLKVDQIDIKNHYNQDIFEDNFKKFLFFENQMIYNDDSNILQKYLTLKTHCLIWGYNKQGQLGSFINNNDSKKIPHLLPLKQPIRYISLGFNSSMALTENGNVYSWGSNDFGKLGLEIQQPSIILIPQRIKSLSRIHFIQCGQNHCFAINSKMELLAWGSGQNGQLGNNSLKDQPKPQLVNFDNNAKIYKAHTGSTHSLVVDTKNRIYVFGDNSKNQLGIENLKFSSKPIQLNLLAKEIKIGEAHNMVLTIQSQVYTWGDNSFGQCGQNSNTVTIPKKLGVNFPIKGIYCGSMHSMIENYSGEFYCFGNNEFYQLGIDTQGKNVFSPTLVKKLNNVLISYIGCGYNHTILQGQQNNKKIIIGWGMNNCQQLLPEKQKQILIQELHQLKEYSPRQISCGQFHSSILI